MVARNSLFALDLGRCRRQRPPVLVKEHDECDLWIANDLAAGDLVEGRVLEILVARCADDFEQPDDGVRLQLHLGRELLPVLRDAQRTQRPEHQQGRDDDAENNLCVEGLHRERAEHA